MRLLTGACALALLALAGCSQAGQEQEPAPAATAEPALTQAWAHDLPLPPNSFPDPVVVADGHWLSTGSSDDSPGTTNPTPNVPLPYTIGDSRTGEVATLPSLGGGPVHALPGTDLFVALGGGRVAVIDPAGPRFVWKRRATIGTEVVDLSATRIWMGRTTRDGQPICFTVDSGRVVRHDEECLAADIGPPNVVDGVSWSPHGSLVQVPGSAEVEVPAVLAHDVETHEQLWSYGALSVEVEDDVPALSYAAFAGSALGLVRADYRGEEATLHLLDVRTGEVVRTLGRVEAGRLVGFSGDIAIFEQRLPDRAPRVSGHPIGS